VAQPPLGLRLPTIGAGQRTVHPGPARVDEPVPSVAHRRRGVLLEWEVLSRHEFLDTTQAQAVVLDWCYDFYNRTRRHNSANMLSPINYENASLRPEAA